MMLTKGEIVVAIPATIVADLEGLGLTRVNRSNDFTYLTPTGALSISIRYSSKYPHTSPDRFKWWWTLVGEKILRTEIVLLLCEGLSGVFAFSGQEFTKPIKSTLDSRGWDLYLYSDGKTFYNFNGSQGIKTREGSNRFIPFDKLRSFLHSAAHGEIDLQDFFGSSSTEQKSASPPPLDTTHRTRLLVENLTELKPKPEPTKHLSTKHRRRRPSAKNLPPILKEEEQGARSVESGTPRSTSRRKRQPTSADPNTQLQVIGTQISRLTSSEQVAVEHLKTYVRAQGFVYDDEVLIRFHTSLKTKPLVILSGLSGSGKSRLPLLYGQAFAAEVRTFPVSPSWSSDSDLLGYYNPVLDRYISTDFLDFILAANASPNKLHIAVLDELNLAKVEHYFSRFLSLLEQPRARRTLVLYSDRLPIKDVPSRVSIGDNLFFVGTVNTDESVHPFSDKVLDRANTLPFGFVDIATRPKPASASTYPVTTELFAYWRRTGVDEGNYVTPILSELNLLLFSCHTPFYFGHRVAVDIETWVNAAVNLISKRDALDIQIEQRILTKIRGRSEDVMDLIKKLKIFFEKHQLPRCSKVITLGERQLGTGYVRIG